MVNYSLLQGIFPIQRSNPGLLHCRQILYQLSRQGSPFYIPTSDIYELQFLYIPTYTFYYLTLTIAILVSEKWYPIVVLNCISPITNDVKHLLYTFMYFLGRNVYSDPLLILKIGLSFIIEF